jgi:hypothetical protein
MGDRFDPGLCQRWPPPQRQVDGDVFSLSCSDCRADKTYPEYEISDQWVSPRQTRGEEIPEDDLKKGDKNHEA